MKQSNHGYIYFLEHSITGECRYLHDIINLVPPRVDVIIDRMYAMTIFEEELANETYLFLANCLPIFTVTKKLVDLETFKRDNDVFLSLPGEVDTSCIDIN